MRKVLTVHGQQLVGRCCFTSPSLLQWREYSVPSRTLSVTSRVFIAITRMSTFYHVVDCSLFSHLYVEVPCIERSLRLSNQNTFYDLDSHRAVTNGILEACINGNFLQVCVGATIDLILANTVCLNLGYDGKSVPLSGFRVQVMFRLVSIIYQYH